MTKHVPSTDLATVDLLVDAVYEGGHSGNAGDDPLTRLIGVSNQGGFRYLGRMEAPRLIVLTSSFDDPDWPDSIDRETGLVTYFGDNKKPGHELHDTPRFGNILLRNIFHALHSNPAQRGLIPPILIFGKSGAFRDMVFYGLAVPGFSNIRMLEDLVAVWKLSKGKRFQNYRASFTLLNIPMVTRKWIEDIKAGCPLSDNCPEVWRRWVLNGAYAPLTAKKTVEYRDKNEQMPPMGIPMKFVQIIHSHFKSNPTGFEKCAADIARMMDTNFYSYELTRPSRDGGRDAIGLYRIGTGPSALYIDFALEAKCYASNNSVGVKDMSRLISRLRYRQFGVLVTTSYIDLQAYKELKEDGHPVIIISARDIVDILYSAGINTISDLSNWLVSNYAQ